MPIHKQDAMIKLPSEYLVESETDKCNHFHRYGDFYDMLIPSLYYQNRTIPLRVLEIGVSRFGVGSGHAFCMMPEVKQFVGIDTERLTDPFPNNKGKFIQGDAYDIEMVESLSKYPPFDLIIDDGSHRTRHQNFVIEHYIKLLKPLGALVIEDTHSPDGITDKRVAFYKHSQSGKGGRIAYVINHTKRGL